MTTKEFSPKYLIKSAYNAAANEIARDMVARKYGRPVRGSKMNAEANELVRVGAAVPTRERYTEILRDLCARHNVEFEGGLDAFVEGSWRIRDQMGRDPSRN